MRNTVLLVALSLLPSGCGSDRPRAPALRNDPVFQNDREGLRFLAPDGWTQRMRGEIPSGKVDKERPLVEFRRIEGGASALRISRCDLPESTDLGEYLAGPSYGVTRWRTLGQPLDSKAGGAPAVRYSFSGRAGSADMAREVVAVRRGERVYFFNALFEPRDTEVRDQLRRVVESVVWKN